MRISILPNFRKRLLLAMVIFVAPMMALAQTTVNIYMKDGTQVVNSSDTYNFYDSHGPSHASDGTINFWDRWYNHNEEFTFTFTPATTDYKIKVQFNTFTAYDKDGNSIGDWALRLNDDYLYVYEGEGINNSKLIAAYTGNSQTSFTVMADGAITFYFRSNEKYREEGWAAVVTQEAAMAPQAPFIRRATCDNEIELLPTTRKAKIYYTTVTGGFGNPDDPTTSSTFLYTQPIDFTGDMTVKAISVLNGQTSPTSSVVTVDIPASELLSAPAVPTVTLTADNMVVMTPPNVPSGLNETYVVRYTMTTDDSTPDDPELRTSTLYTEPIPITVPGTKMKARTFAVSCDNWRSAVVSETYSAINAPLPVITFSAMENKVTATQNGVNYDILYTTDGTDPSTNSPMHGTWSGNGLLLLNEIVRPGMTIKALAYKANNDPDHTPNTTQYTPSAVVSAIYVPNGTEVSGNIVLLDDREDHSWSYYSDADNPIHCLKPADIKITYYGNGENNMTTDDAAEIVDAPTTFSADASGVKVSPASGEDQNTYIYLKTLENANPEGSASNNAYPYTTIANPFTVRPTYTGFTTNDPIQNVNVGLYDESGKSNMLPTKTNSNYSTTQQIYTKEEIGRSGKIKAITFYCTPYTDLTRNLTVYMKQTSKTSFTSDTDWESVANSDKVFEGNVTFKYSTTITLSTPFDYDGSENLLICVDDNTGTASDERQFWIYPTNKRSICVNGSTNHNPTTSMSSVTGTRCDYNDQIEFTFDGGVTTNNDLVEVGSSENSNYTIPTYTDDRYEQSAQIYTASEIGQGGNITSIAFRTSNNNSATRHLRIYMAHTTATGFSNGWTTLNGLFTESGYQFDGNVTFVNQNTNDGWTTIELTTPFVYDGTNNLVIYIQDRTGTYQTANPYFYRYNTGRNYACDYRYQDDAFSTSTTTGVGWAWPSQNNRNSYCNQINFNFRSYTQNPDIHVTIGDREGFPAIPIATGYKYSVSQQIFTADELKKSDGTANTGKIHSIQLRSYNGAPSRNISIYLKHTTKNAFEDASDWVSMSTTNLVFSGSVTFTNNGWTTIVFDDDFSYDGVRNLVVCIDDDSDATTTPPQEFNMFSSDNSKRTLYYYSNSYNPPATALSGIGTLSNLRTKIQFAGPTSKGEGKGDRFDDYTGGFETGYDGWSFAQGSTNYWVRGTAVHNGEGSYSLYISNNGTNNQYTYNNGIHWSYAYQTYELEAGIYSISYDWRCHGDNSNDYCRVVLAPGEQTPTANAQISTLNNNTTPSGWVALDGGAPLYTNSTSPTWKSQSIDLKVTTGGKFTVIILWHNNGAVQYQPPAAIDNISITKNAMPYRGFYAWKVKSITNGLTIKSKDGLTTYSVEAPNNIIPADTEIQFITDKAEGNEVEFEALWAQAYVSETATDLGFKVAADNPTARERNFHVVKSATAASSYAKSYPLTVSSYYPNGTSGGGSVSGAFSAAADTKFENISITGATSATWDAAGHNLTVGRGVSGTVNRVDGLSANTNNAVKYTIRLESGTFNIFNLISYAGATLGSTVQAKAVFGCDYDRANNENDNLDLAPSGQVYGKNYNGGGSLVFSSSTNRNNITFDWLVKSGKIQSNLKGEGWNNLGSAEGGDESIYLGAPTSANNLQYAGKRRIIIEGGEMASIAGGVNNSASGYATYAVNDGDPTVMIRMKGGTVHGAIYGGGEYGASSGNVRMVYTGGTVQGWVAGGCNGTHDDGGEQYGSTFIYVGGNAKVVQTGDDPFVNPDDTRIGTTNSYGTNGAYGGNIFGAGCGIKPTGFNDNIDGTVTNPGDPCTTVGKVFGSTIVMADNGEVGRDIYGGGKFGLVASNTTGNYGLGAENNNMRSRIYILGGTVHGDVMGGAQNQIHQTTEIYIRGGQLVGRKKNRPGSGVLNTLEYYGDVYGGSDTWGTTNGTAKIEMTGGQLTNIFGGGYGIGSRMSQDVTVTVSGGNVKGTVYGGGETGFVDASTHVNINGGSVNDVFGAGKGGDKSYNKATITGQTFVNVSGGTVNGAAYGGGEMGNVYVGTATENFNSLTAAAYNATTSHHIAGGWYRDCSSTNAYVPRVSNYSNYSSIANNDGNYLLFSANQGGTGWALAVMPTFTDIASISFNYRNSNGTYGTLELGYYVENTYTKLKDLSRTTSWTTYNVSTDDISTINSNNGRIAFRFTGRSSNDTWYSAAIDNITVTTNVITASTVTVTGGTIEGDVFGGGNMGRTTGNSVVTVNGGLLKQNVFGGAYGVHDTVFIAGQKTVNIMNGQIVGSVYGGSHDANDGLDFYLKEAFDSGASSTTTETSSIIDITGGQIDQQVYAAGYYGNTFGSVYTFIGLKATEDAPNHYRAPGVDYEKHKLIIKGNVWAGSDWGVYTSGTFGSPNITGNSNIYIDGTGYKTNDKDNTQEYYMKLRGSIYGCGTSADAGKGQRQLIVKNFGEDLANRDSDKDASPFLASTEINSIQRWHHVRVDNSHIRMLGQGRINSSDLSEQYSLYCIDKSLHVANGSTLVMNAPADSLANLHSVTCADIYATTPTYTVVAYNGLGEPGSATDNKLRINNGAYLKVKNGSDYGQLNGFFHLMKGVDGNGSDIYARPKDSDDGDDPDAGTTGNNHVAPGNDNADDGGFVGYLSEDNTYDIDGGTTGTLVQIPYENHTPLNRNGEAYYRIWRFGGEKHSMAAVFNAIADGSATYEYKTVQVTVALPSWRAATNYYRFDRDDEGYALIDYGNDVITYNAANYQASSGSPTGVAAASDKWMFFNTDKKKERFSQESSNDTIVASLAEIDNKKDLNFGLMVEPNSGLKGNKNILCAASSSYLAGDTVRYTCGTGQLDQTPMLTFKLTYSNSLSLTRTNDPILIPLVQCDEDGNIVDRVTVSLTIATSTSITMGSKWKMYAIMDNSGSAKDRTTLRVEIPKFQVHNTGQESEFKLKSATFIQTITDVLEGEALKYNGSTVELDEDGTVEYRGSDESAFGLNTFGLVMEPVVSQSSSDTWRFASGELDPHGGGDQIIGYNGGRSPVALDFTLIYSGIEDVTSYTAGMDIPRVPMGTLTLKFEFDNYEYGDSENDYKAEFDIVVEVYRKGQARNFYLDNVNGANIVSGLSGDYPNTAYKTMNFLLNRSDFLPGDNIFVMNTITMGKETTWDGNAFQSKVNVYRYPGGHTQTPDAPSVANTALTGALVDVKEDLTINGMTFDGMKDVVTAEAPLFKVEDGSTLSLGTNVTLQNNNNSNGDGGAVHVDYGGTLKMNDNATITNNISNQGGGVFMDGKMIVSGNVKVTDNGTAENSSYNPSDPNSTKTTNDANVWLAPVANAGEDYRVLQVGTSDNDGFGPLESGAKIGIHKTDWSNGVDGYMPVVVSESGTPTYLDLPYQHPQTIIVPDVAPYALEQYNDVNTLYWVSSWVTAVTSAPTGFDATAIDTPEDLAWLISLVNGENHVGETGYPEQDDFDGKTVNLTADLDMSEHMWVPIGDETTPFKGTFNGNGHTITGIGSTLGNDYMGLFGQTEDADIKDLTVQTSIESNTEHLGTVAGKMSGGSLTNVGGAGNLTSLNYTDPNTIGGLVGTSTLTVIHSSYAATTIQGTSESTVGGLVGDNGSNLYNAYADITLGEDNTATDVGGLVGYHRSGYTVENCYSIIHNQDFPAFAALNAGTIQYCYADKANGYVGGSSTGTLTGHGTYGATLDRKAIGYMYDDNKVTLASGTTAYVHDAEIDYTNNHTVNWNGLLWSMNKWVTEKNASSTTPYSTYKPFTVWFRPTTKAINDDLPILGFANDNSLATTDGKFLQYGSTAGGANGIDALLVDYSGQTASIFLYGNATNVANVPTSGVKVFINEDACLIQQYDPEHPELTLDFTNAIVGVTFDNSYKNAKDYFNNKLDYDWHLLSSPLSNAPMGITYNGSLEIGYNEPVNISSMIGNYLPNSLRMGSGYDDAVRWDLYSYFEPEYHWINLKRSGNNHWHYDEPHDQIAYNGGGEENTNETIFIPGKGYMMAISQDSYMSSTGTLNKGNVTIKLTNTVQSPDWEDYFSQGCNLIGNPYQAYLDLEQLATPSFSAFYTYDADQNAYLPYVSGSSENPHIPSQYIHPHQAFFVMLSNTTNPHVDVEHNFEFTPSMVTTTSNAQSYFRGDKVNYPLVNLFVENEQGAKNYTIVEVGRPELGGAEKSDALKTTNFDLYAHYGEGNYKLLFTPAEAQRVPVFFRTEEDGNFTITWDTYHGPFHFLRLIDNIAGTECDMLANDHYSFYGQATDYAARFYLVFDNPSEDPQDPDSAEHPFAFNDGYGWIVNGSGQLQLVDVLGRVLHSEYLPGEMSRVNFDRFAAGAYVLRLSGSQGVKTQKIIID